jgi:hypothetical protein
MVAAVTINTKVEGRELVIQGFGKSLIDPQLLG